MPEPIDHLLRSNLRGFSAYKPGTSVDEARRRYGVERVAKLSQNENPLGSSPKALAALKAVPTYSDYVEDDYLALREILAKRAGLTLDNVVLGNGSNELIMVLHQAFVDPGDDIVMGVPSFALFKKDAIVADANPIEVPLHNGVHDLDAMLRAVTPRTKMLFVCDPNNPTGTRVERAALERFARELHPDVLLVIDQAYREYMDPGGADGVAILHSRPATVVLRTVSKVYGLAALRFGYAYSSPAITSWLWRVRLPFNVSRSAAVATEAALGDIEFVERSRALNEAGKQLFYREFARLGLEYYPSAANFVAVRLPILGDEAFEALLARGVIVRSGDGLSMPGWLRVSIGTPDENAMFLEALEDLLPTWQARALEPVR